MANIFVNSNATGANDGSDWANAYVSITSAFSAAVQFDKIIIADVHSESFATTQQFNIANDVTLLSSTVSGVDTVTETEATTAQITTTAGNADLWFTATDGVVIYGLWIESGRSLYLNDVRTERCTLKCATLTGNGTIGLNSPRSGWESYYDTRVDNGFGTTAVITAADRSIVQMFGGTIESLSTNAGQAAIDLTLVSTFVANGVDCSNFTNPNLLGDVTNIDAYVDIKNFKLNPNTTNLVESTVTKQSSYISIDATDSSNNQRVFNNEYRGQRDVDDSIYIDDAKAFQNQSHKFETNSVTKGLTEPLRLLLTQGIADFSTAKTLTIEIAQDGTTTQLTDAEVWIEVEYPLANNQTAFDNDRAANTPSAANQPVSTQSWVGLSGTNSRQKCEVTTTQTGVNGLYTVYLCLAKPSTTIYANPEAQVS